VFANADVPYLLSYSMIMLDTDLSNPNVKRHMTVDEFIAHCRGINDGGDLPNEYLREVFRSIQESPLTLV